MTYTLDDYFRAFHSLKETLKLSAGSQAVYISILGVFAAEQFPERIGISIRELKELAGLKSTNAVFESRNVLKNHKLIDFRNENGTTVYSLATEHLLNSKRTLTEHLLNSERTSAEHLPNGEAVAYCTRESESGGNVVTPFPHTPNPQKTDKNNKKKSASQIGRSDAGRQAGEDVFALWQRLTGKELSPADRYTLERLDDMHGREVVEAAIREHVYRKGKSFSYFVKCVESIATCLERGSERSARVAGQSRVNGRNVLRFDAGRTGNNCGDSQTGAQTTEGRFDNDEPDYSWLDENRDAENRDAKNRSSESAATPVSRKSSG